MQGNSLFLLSFGQRDPLSARCVGFGWQVTSARRADDLNARFLASGALIAVVDTRGYIARARGAIAALASYASEYGVSILALGDGRADRDAAEFCHDAGATHYHDMALDPDGLEMALRYAFRFSELQRGGADRLNSLNAIMSADEAKWRICKGDIARSQLDGDVARVFGVTSGNSQNIISLYRKLEINDRRRFRRVWSDLKTGQAHTAFAHEISGRKIIHHINQTEQWIEARLEFVGSERELSGWANRDALSGLRNAASARAWIRRKLQDATSVNLAIFGVRNFATINAAYGRATGDELMRIVGQRLMAASPGTQESEQIIARMDGQNFVFAMPLSHDDTDFHEKVRHMLDTAFAPARIDGRTVQIVARAGIAQSAGQSEEVVVIRRASLALAEAMMSDSFRIKAWQESETDILLEQELERDLAAALENDEIKIALQPQIRIATGQLTGAEALARWQHPHFGFLGAATLFSVADRAGMMDILSAHIHDVALKIAGNWPESLSFLRLSINITAGDLSRADFAAEILDKVAASGITPDRITLEITESDLIADMSGAVETLTKLRDAGIAIAIDDFGTGYSSLSYLKNLPLDYLKIDSGLTDDIGGSQKDQVVVRSIIDMAKSLELSVIAEGVETESQLATLAELHCDYFQGFLRAGPLYPQEFERFALLSN